MTDAEALEQLETLRKKKRTPVKEGLVRAVMVQDSDFHDKIRRIEVIDLMPDEEEALPEAPPAVTRKPRGVLLRPEKVPGPVAAEPPPKVDPELTEAKRVEHYRRSLGKLPVRGGLWAYLTREYGALVRFGARTSTLTRGFLPFTLRLSSEALAFLTRTLKKQVLPVLDQTLPLLLKKSWLHLTKYEYNLLVGLRDLVRLAASVPTSEEDRRGGGAAWDPVVPALRLFWTAPDLVDRTTHAWETATARLNLSEKVRLAGVDSIRTLLEARLDAQSFPDVLQAVLMIRARRHMDWGDTGPIEPGEYFLRDSFECTPDVQAEVDRACDVLSEQLEALGREAQEIRRIRYYLPAQNLLAEFEVTDDRSEATLWCQGLLTLLEAALSPLLEGTVVFADGTQTTLFQNPSLASTLARMRTVESQMADPIEGQNPELRATAARVIMNLGKTLVILIRTRSVTADPLVRAADTETVEDPLPFEQSVLDQPSTWAGLTVVEALIKAARVCLQAGRVLGDTTLETSLEKEVTIPGRMTDLLARLSRLAPPNRVEALKARWENAVSLLE